MVLFCKNDLVALEIYRLNRKLMRGDKQSRFLSRFRLKLVPFRFPYKSYWRRFFSSDM